MGVGETMAKCSEGSPTKANAPTKGKGAKRNEMATLKGKDEDARIGLKEVETVPGLLGSRR